MYTFCDVEFGSSSGVVYSVFFGDVCYVGLPLGA